MLLITLTVGILLIALPVRRSYAVRQIGVAIVLFVLCYWFCIFCGWAWGIVPFLWDQSALLIGWVAQMVWEVVTALVRMFLLVSFLVLYGPLCFVLALLRGRK